MVKLMKTTTRTVIGGAAVAASAAFMVWATANSKGRLADPLVDLNKTAPAITRFITLPPLYVNAPEIKLTGKAIDPKNAARELLGLEKAPRTIVVSGFGENTKGVRPFAEKLVEQLRGLGQSYGIGVFEKRFIDGEPRQLAFLMRHIGPGKGRANDCDIEPVLRDLNTLIYDVTPGRVAGSDGGPEEVARVSAMGCPGRIVLAKKTTGPEADNFTAKLIGALIGRGYVIDNWPHPSNEIHFVMP